MKHPFSLWFFGPDESRLGNVESPVVPSIGDLLGVPGDQHLRAVTATQWTFTHPDSPAAREGSVAIVHVLLSEPRDGIFRP